MNKELNISTWEMIGNLQHSKRSEPDHRISIDLVILTPYVILIVCLDQFVL